VPPAKSEQQLCNFFAMPSASSQVRNLLLIYAAFVLQNFATTKGVKHRTLTNQNDQNTKI
jgi:hypothetical protein